jgi:hypothetical protein
MKAPLTINIIHLLGNTGGGLDFALRSFENICRSMGHDVTVYLNTNTFMHLKKYPIAQEHDVFFDVDDTSFHMRSADVTIIYSFNWPMPGDWKRASDEERGHIMESIHAQHELLTRPSNGKLVFINVSHILMKYEKLGIELDPSLFCSFDSIITFGPGDHLIPEIEKNNCVFDNMELRNKIHYIQHNTLFCKDKQDWRPPEDKHLNQFYWQGRGPSWKRWDEWLDFKERCSHHHIDLNLLMNGLMPSIGNVNKLTVTMKPKVYKPFLEYDKRKYTSIAFHDTIDDKARIYSEYKHDDGLELVRSAGSVMYTTKLPADMNFIPEYAMFDALLNGTVLSVPSWYFDDMYKDGTPDDYGLIALPQHDTDDEWNQFSYQFDRLQHDSAYYETMRSTAYDYFVGSVDYQSKVESILNTVH